MAKKKSRVSRISNGGRQKANLAREKKRQEKFAKKRESGNIYVYQKNPYKKGTNEYNREADERREKNKSKKTEVAQWDSVMSKLNAWIIKDKEAKIKAKAKVKKKTAA